MRKHYLPITVLLICGLILGGVVAQASQGSKQSGSANGSSSTVSEPKGEQVQTQESTQEQKQTHDRIRERTNQDEETPCFTAEDGNTYRWQNRFSRKLLRFEEDGDEEAMHKYLEKIANRYNFEYNSGVDDFIHWAVQNRPWDTE